MKKRYTRKGGKIEVHYEETLNDNISSTKGRIRDRVEKEVGDTLDNLADISKLVSFSIMTMSLLYKAIDRSKLTAKELTILDQGFKIFNDTDTIASDNFNESGLKSIEPLLKKLSDIRNIKNTVLGKD